MKYQIFIFLLFIPVILAGRDITITHGPYIQAVGENEATIVWTTDKDAVSWVELAPAGENSFYAEEHPRYYQTSHGNKVVTKLHRIRIAHLKKGTGYRYRVFSKEVLKHEGHIVLYGKVASTNVYRQSPLRFTTLDAAKSEISFCMVNDIHGNSDTLQALLENVQHGTADLVFFNGDMVSSMLDETQFFEGFMDRAVKMFASEVPVCFARGNHETRGPFSVSFPDYFPSGNGKLYYSFRQGPVYFIVLDGGEDKPDSDIEYSGLARFDEYRDEQQSWLREVTGSEEFKTSPFKVAVLHIPPVGSAWHGPLDIKRKLVPVLNEAGIDIMLCGHTHRFAYIEPDGEELKFPVFINGNSTMLQIQAGQEKMVIERKNTKGTLLGKQVLTAGN